jgi:hypothetical protein
MYFKRKFKLLLVGKGTALIPTATRRSKKARGVIRLILVSWSLCQKKSLNKISFVSQMSN